MIKVTMSKNENGDYNSICLEGHAEYAEYGQDIVCAAVSILFINTVNSIEQFTKDVVQVHDEQEKTGKIGFRFVSSISDDSKLLMNSLMLGLEGIKEEYSEKYIRIFK